MSAANGNGSGPFRYSEARFSAFIGLSRRDAKYLREDALKENVDWSRVQGEIAITLDGIKKLWKRLPDERPTWLPLADFVISHPQKKEPLAPPLASAPRTMWVRQLPLNPFQVRARDQLGQEYVVRVKRNDVFHVGLEIEARPDPVHTGFWQVCGPVPRWPGDRAYRIGK